jgi:peptidoglycan hydrolase-like protein with peptidoglycan-binding domain
MQSTNNPINNPAIAAQEAHVLNKPQLSIGSQGPAVKEMQGLLNYWGCSLVKDGIFGPKTLAAVKAFQEWVFLTPDGIVGPKTWHALYDSAPVHMPILKLGSIDPAVRIMEQVLADYGYFFGNIDEVFTPYTDAVVRNFQQNTGLVVDGIVGPKTWYALRKLRPFACPI